MDKTLMINQIIEYYKFSSDAEFARHLGIRPQVLSNWKNRSTFDPELIYTKCLDINPEWLLTGKGEMLRSAGVEAAKPPPVDARDAYIIELQKEKIAALEGELRRYKRELEACQERELVRLERTIEGKKRGK